LLFGNALPVEPGIIVDEFEQLPSASGPRTIRDYVDKLIDRQSRLINAAIQSQVKINNDNLTKRYSTYHRTPKLRQRTLGNDNDDHTGTTIPILVANIIPAARPAIRPSRKWILNPNPPSRVGNTSQNEEEEMDTTYVRIPLDQEDDNVVDTINEIDLNPYVVTTYEVNDFVLRRYPVSKAGKGNPDKYGSYWRGPYLVTKVTRVPMVYGPSDKIWYTIQNLVTSKEFFADVTHLRPFYFDPDFVTPLNVAAKDTDEHVVKKILRHDFSDPANKRWLVLWAVDETEEETWEPLEVLKDVEAFHHYCASHGLDAFLPKEHPRFSASVPQMKRLTPGKFTLPTMPIPNQGPKPKSRKRGRPKKSENPSVDKDGQDQPPEDA
jgi:hypothetical protein